MIPRKVAQLERGLRKLLRFVEALELTVAKCRFAVIESRKQTSDCPGLKIKSDAPKRLCPRRVLQHFVERMRGEQEPVCSLVMPLGRILSISESP